MKVYEVDIHERGLHKGTAQINGSYYVPDDYTMEEIREFQQFAEDDHITYDRNWKRYYMKFLDDDCRRMAKLLHEPCEPACHQCSVSEWMMHNWEELAPLMEEV